MLALTLSHGGLRAKVASVGGGAGVRGNTERVRAPDGITGSEATGLAGSGTSTGSGIGSLRGREPRGARGEPQGMRREVGFRRVVGCRQVQGSGIHLDRRAVERLGEPALDHGK